MRPMSSSKKNAHSDVKTLTAGLVWMERHDAGQMIKQLKYVYPSVARPNGYLNLATVFVRTAIAIPVQKMAENVPMAIKKHAMTVHSRCQNVHTAV